MLNKIIQYSRNSTKVKIIAKRVNRPNKHFETGVIYIPDFDGDYIMFSRPNFDSATIQIKDILKIIEV